LKNQSILFEEFAQSILVFLKSDFKNAR